MDAGKPDTGSTCDRGSDLLPLHLAVGDLVVGICSVDLARCVGLGCCHLNFLGIFEVALILFTWRLPSVSALSKSIPPLPE